MEDIVLSERIEAVLDTAPDKKAHMVDRLSIVLRSLEDSKAEDLVTIPLSGKSEIADHMVIASGRSSRQVSSIAEHLTDALKPVLGQIPAIEGKEAGDWVLIDAGDVIVHIFRPEVREFYQLEKMWLSPSDAVSTTH